jgi:hypothetical protein
VVRRLRHSQKIGHPSSGAPFIEGHGPVRWGVVGWQQSDVEPISFFTLIQPQLIVVMAGSVHHLIGGIHRDRQYLTPVGSGGAGGSALPTIIQAIRFSAERQKDLAGVIHNDQDYLFALGFVHGKLVERTQVRPLPFVEQEMTFVARSFKRLKRPSDQQLAALLNSAGYSSKDKQELRLIAQSAPDILLCSPLYVALTDSSVG